MNKAERGHANKESASRQSVPPSKWSVAGMAWLKWKMRGSWSQPGWDSSLNMWADQKLLHALFGRNCSQNRPDKCVSKQEQKSKLFTEQDLDKPKWINFSQLPNKDH